MTTQRARISPIPAVSGRYRTGGATDPNRKFNGLSKLRFRFESDSNVQAKHVAAVWHYPVQRKEGQYNEASGDRNNAYVWKDSSRSSMLLWSITRVNHDHLTEQH